MWVIFAISVLLLSVSGSHEPLESKHLIDIVNNFNTTWKAGHNFNPNLSIKYAKSLTGLKLQESRDILLPLENLRENGLQILDELPREFDARKKWPNCTALQEVRDQGNCGSCWAVSTASAFTDRLCIHTSGEFNGHLSAEELMTCCTQCGWGCNTGFPDRAWMYIKDHGIVTGGDYNSEEGCQPYLRRPCEHAGIKGPRKPCSRLGSETWTPKCQKSCTNERYKKSFKKDHHKVRVAYSLLTVDDMMRNIYKYGPIVVGFYVYQDFLSYKTGVYQYIDGSFIGGHAVKIIGWGTENNVDYWLVANSWNSDWGNRGFFKIKRGVNECYIETETVTAGEL